MEGCLDQKITSTLLQLETVYLIEKLFPLSFCLLENRELEAGGNANQGKFDIFGMMECNREEGLRAGRIALIKLKKKDFRGAQRIALKAQRLYPELENLSQLLAICEVHCAAEAEINGDLDWYGILQVEATANDEVITKQYCKLSCLLHPEHNTLPGAEAAFMLVCIAHKILCDHMTHFLHDIKTQHVFRKVAKKATHLSDSTHGDKGDAIGQRVPSELIFVFRTICPHCQKQFLFYQKNIFVRCDDCCKTFFAFKLHEESMPLRFLPPAPYNAQVSPVMLLSCHPNRLDCTKLQSTVGDMDSRAANATQSDEHVKWDSRSCYDGEGNFSEIEGKAVQLLAVDQINSPVAAIDKDTTESMTLEPNLTREDACALSNAKAAGSYRPRRFDKRKQDDVTASSHNIDSCNNKRQKIYDSVSKARLIDDTMCNENAASSENQSSDQCPNKFGSPEKGNTTCEEHTTVISTQMSASVISTQMSASVISTQMSASNSMITRACPDIFNFETYRDANRFTVGQIWALYDEFDAMPRFYARIMHSDAHNGKIHLTWLDHEATNKEEENWTSKKLLIACGSFRLRPTIDISQDRLMFSHIVAWTKGKKGNSYDIYPNKGEVWALYKGWSKQWSSDADNHRSCEYVVVEVLSNMSANDGATVIPLVKIKDFVSLFAKAKGMSSFFVPSSEVLRFSHSISFYRTNGNEKMGVPRDFLELDTACLPSDHDGAFSSVTLMSYIFLGNMTGCVFSDSTTESADNKMDCGDELISSKENFLEQNVCHSISADDTDDISSEQNTSTQKNAHGANEFGDSFQSQQNCMSPNGYSYPDPEFHDFEEGRSLKKFKQGQIWAMYSDTNKFPNYYACIRKVDPKPFRVHLNWLEVCPKSEHEKWWLEQHLSISCGTFEVRDWRTEYDTFSVFSHLVDARPTGMKWQFEVLPQIGQIWATYMNWAPGWVPPSDGACEYIIGEIIKRTKAGTKLAVLTKVGGYRCVFKPDNTKGVLEIPSRENLRFSHLIPSFRLTEEMGGTLRGFYELDPASLPDVFLYKDN